MGFWSWMRNVTPNGNTGDPPSVGPGHNPGDPDGLVLEGEATSSGERAAIIPSPWDGWPADWSPQWSADPRFNNLVDTAWACLDLNSNVLSTMPVYRTRNGRVIEPATWMRNPDPTTYTSWHEFAKQLFWDYQLGEAFVLPMEIGADLKPSRFRVIPPWLVNVEMSGTRRTYNIGSLDVTGEILHIRYKSTTESARGVGPLEAAGARTTAAAVLSRYIAELVSSGGVPYLTLETDFKLTREEADELREQWVTSRRQNVGKPAVLHTGVKASDHQMSPKDMAMLEISQFTEARIATICGVPPFLVGLTLPGSSETYSNVLQLFDFHDRASLRPKAAQVMSAMSWWALPRGQSLELNRDEYSRPGFKDRVEAYRVLHEIQDETGRGISSEEIRDMERLRGTSAVESLTGGDLS